MDGCEMSLLQHASSLLLNLQRLHLDSLFSDLQIFCDDGVIQSYRLLVGGCSEMVRACLAPESDLEVDTLILPGLTVTDLHTFHNCLYSSSNISQAELQAVLRVLVALGGDITRYIEVKKPPSEASKESESSGEKVTEDTLGEVVETTKREHQQSRTRSERVIRQTEKSPVKDSQTTTYTLAVNEKDEIVSKSGPKFACDKCYLEFDKETELEKHLKTDCSKQHFCETCNKVFSSSQTFTNHMKLHTKELEFKCYVCGKCYVSRSVLGNHMKTHDENNKIPRFHCDHCEKKFNHPSNLKRHIRTAHFELSDKKIYECPDCDKTFKDPSARKHHLKIHLEVRPYPCEGCDKSFATKSQLESHVRIHTGEKPFVCNMCGRCFVTKGQLKSHRINRHVGVKHSKSHLCQDCGQSFVKEYDLKVHMRKHTGERPFQCLDCGKTFRSERNLVNHQRIHTGDKPYKCETCAKGFASCAGLRQHFKCHANCRLQATEGAYCKQDRKTNRYGRVRLDSIPELPLEAATTGLQNLESFSVSELKAQEEGVEETVVYFNTDSGLGIGIEGVTIQGALEEVTNIEGVTIQAIGLEMDVGEEGQVLSLVQIDEGITQM